jgi:hypothetical protein
MLDKSAKDSIKSNHSKQAMLLIFLLFLSTLAAIPSATVAHTPEWTFDTWTYAVVSPDIVGVGQTTWVVFWLNYVPPLQLVLTATDGLSPWKSPSPTEQHRQ